MQEVQEGLMLLVQLMILGALAVARQEVKRWLDDLRSQQQPSTRSSPTWPASGSSDYDRDQLFVEEALHDQLVAWNLGEEERRRIAAFIVLERRLRPTYQLNAQKQKEKDRT
jgi:hypothetical protein